MDTETQEIVLRLVEDQWRHLPAEGRPWGVWITRHVSVPEDLVELDRNTSRVTQAWFLEQSGLRESSVESFRRFYAVQFVQPWCAYLGGTCVPTNEGRNFEIAMAGFAQYGESRDVYAEMIFGPLLGRGYRLSPRGASPLKELWVS